MPLALQLDASDASLMSMGPALGPLSAIVPRYPSSDDRSPGGAVEPESMHVFSRTLTVLLAAGIALFSGHDEGPAFSDRGHVHAAGTTGLGDLQQGEFHVVPPGEPGQLPATEIDARTVAFHPSGDSPAPRATRKAPKVNVFQTGTNAFEPTMGIDSKGRVFFVGADGAQWPLFPTQTMRTSDNGKTWDNVTPKAPQDHPTTEDPYLYMDEDTDRVFTSDFVVPCTVVSRSDDAGNTWASSVTGCDLLDHQTIFAGKPVTSQPIGYPNVVYYCASDYATGMSVSCLKSIEGGQVFFRTGEPAFPGVSDSASAAQCGWGSGHGVAGPDGTIYLPAGVCSHPTLAISRDEGSTWERVEVANIKMGSDGRRDHDAAVAVDSESNLYYSWTGADLKPYLSVSKDGGDTWSKPLMIAPPGVEIATLIALDVAAPGNLAVSFVGSEAQAEFGPGEYNGYMMMTTDALSGDPLFYASRINATDDPIDGACSTGSCAANREFIDVSIAPDGSVWASFADGCYDGSCSHYDKPLVGIPVGRGIAARLVGGARLDQADSS